MPYAFNPLTGLLDNISSEVPQIIHAKVHNADSVALQRGDVVYSFGAVGDTMSVKLASNLSDATASKTLGFVNSTIAPGSTGLVTIAGRMEKLHLGSPFVDGDTLWLDSTPGKYTRVKPTAPNHSVYLGVAERANNGNGIAYIKVQNGLELDELHDVLVTSVSAGQVLRRNGANTVWQNTNDGAKWDSGYTTVQANSAVTWNNIVPLRFSHSSYSPPDSTSVYIGDINDMAPLATTTTPNRFVVAPVKGLITTVTRQLFIGGTNGSNEASEFAIHNITTSLSSLITNNLLFDATQYNAFTLVTPLSVSFGDLIALRQTYPVFATNPTTIRQTFNVLISQRQ